jgi:predicted nucleic acid-binding protein
MRAALDTNILAYAEGVGDAVRCDAARSLIERLPAGKVLLPAQTLGELFRVITAKKGLSAPSARELILGWGDAFEVADSTWGSFQAALDLVADHQLQIWDALIMAVAADNHCRFLLTEDLQSGFTWRGVTIINPFTQTDHPHLVSMLS